MDIQRFADPAPLLHVRRICEVHVRKKLLANNTSVGTAFNVDANLDMDVIMSNLVSVVLVISCVRRGGSLALTFEGTTAPPLVFLYNLRRPPSPATAPSVLPLRLLRSRHDDLLVRRALPLLWWQASQENVLHDVPTRHYLRRKPLIERTTLPFLAD